MMPPWTKKAGSAASPQGTEPGGHGRTRKAAMNIGMIGAVGILCALLGGGCVETSSGSNLLGMTTKLTRSHRFAPKAAPPGDETVSAGAMAYMPAGSPATSTRQLDDTIAVSPPKMTTSPSNRAPPASPANGTTRRDLASRWSHRAPPTRSISTPAATSSTSSPSTGQGETRRSTAYRQPDGSWHPIS